MIFLNHCEKKCVYADDTTSLKSTPDINALKAVTQTVIQDVAVWFSVNGFLLNDSKNILFGVKHNLQVNSSILRHYKI